MLFHDRLEEMLLTVAESEEFGSWDDPLSRLVGDILLRYPSDELSDDDLALAAGGVAPLLPDTGKTDDY